MADNRWILPNSPPPPLFLGKKERDLVKQLNDEISERIVGQTILYYPVDLKTTNFHPLYGEAMDKSFLPPVRVYALVKWNGDETTTDISLMDKTAKLTINFHRRRLTEDQDLFVREGDFVFYARRFWEVTNLIEPRLLFGQQEHKFEIRAECIRARDGLFREPSIIADIQTILIEAEEERAGPVTEAEIVQVITSSGIPIFNGDDATFIQMAINPSAHSGKIIYLTTLGVQVFEPFNQANKFYFNENGVWYVSSMFSGF